MRLLHLSLLVLIAFFTNKISAARYVALGNSRYGPYEALFNKKPKLKFRKQYYNRYISDAVNEIDNSRPKVRVCFNNVINIEDPILNGYHPIYKDSRIIAEYDFSKISKYTSLKFYLTTRNCHINLDFDRPLQQGTLGLTSFFVYNGKPNAEVLLDRQQIENLAYSLGIPYLKAYMQVLMHEILHGLGLGHSEDDHNSGSIIRAVYNGAPQQLLYKKDVYNLRSIYGARRRQIAFSNGTSVEFDYSEPREWDDLVLRNMEENGPKITLNLNKDVSSTTKSPVETTTKTPEKTVTNKPFEPTGAVEPIDPPEMATKTPEKTVTKKPFEPTGAVEPIDPPEMASKSQITQPTTQKPPKTTTQNSEISTIKRPRKTTTEEPNETTSRRPTKTSTKRPRKTTTEEASETTSPRSTKTTTKRPRKTTTEEPSETTSRRPTKTTTKRPRKTTTEETSVTTSRRPSKTTTHKPFKTTTNDPDGTKKPMSLADLQKELSRIKYSNNRNAREHFL